MKHKLHGDVLILGLFAVLVVMALINVALLANISLTTSQMDVAQKAEAEPARLEIVRIFSPECQNCYDVNAALAEIGRQNVNVSQRSIELSSPEGLSLTSKYEINRLPALVVSGEINKTSQLSRFWNQIGTTYGDAAVVEAQLPYYSVGDGKVVGLVALARIIDSSCTQCSSIDSIVNYFEQAGVVIGSRRTVEYNSDEGKNLVNTYGVDAIPAVIVSKDVLDYQAIAQIWPQLNATEKNGSYALHVLQPPYRNLAENKIVGLVDVIYLNDSSCVSCYNVFMHRSILRNNFGVAIINETLLDVNSTQGRALVSKYNIRAAPTFLMSPDARYYSGLMQVWQSVGNETNGWYIFRDISVTGGIYRNLETGVVVVPAG